MAAQVESRNVALYGQESNGSTWALCKMNMFLHSFDGARVEWGDTLNNPKLLEGDGLMRFDIVVANPPFSLDKWGQENAEGDVYQRFHRGVPPKSKADYAFISHMIQTTVEGTGKVGVVVPHGVLFRGVAEGKIRQRLIEENMLEAVIGLPEKLFFGTPIPAAVLLFNKGKTIKDVLFVDASKDYGEGTRQNILRKQDIEKIFTIFQTFKTKEKYSYRATVDEIAENDFNLNVSRYVDTFEEEDPVNIAVAQREIMILEKELVSVRNEMDRYLKELDLDAESPMSLNG